MRAIHELKRGARRRVRSCQFNITLKRATQTDRHRIKLMSVSEEGKIASQTWVIKCTWSVWLWSLYQLAQLRVAFAKISWRAERWRSASTWFGCTLSSLGSMKRMIPFNKQHLLSKESAPLFDAPHLRVLSQNLPNKCQSLPNDAQSNADTVIRNDPRSNCFVSCWFLVHCYQTSLLTTLLPDNIRTAFES